MGSTSHIKGQGEKGNSTGNDTLAYELHGNCYVNITNQCTLKCSFCPKFNKQWDVQGYNLRLSAEPTAADIIQAIGDPGRYHEVVFCGLGEPTMRLSVLLEVAQAIHGRTWVRLNTDGLGNLVQGMDITPELAGKVDAISISLNAQSETVYNHHCRPPQQGTYPALLDFISSAKKQIDDITVTAIDGLVGVDIKACRDIADTYGVKFRRRVLDQVG